MAEGPLHEFVDREVLLLEALVQLGDRAGLLDQKGMAGGQFVGKRRGVHGRIRLSGSIRVFTLHDTYETPPTPQGSARARGDFLSKSPTVEARDVREDAARHPKRRAACEALRHDARE